MTLAGLKFEEGRRSEEERWKDKNNPEGCIALVELAFSVYGSFLGTRFSGAVYSFPHLQDTWRHCSPF